MQMGGGRGKEPGSGLGGSSSTDPFEFMFLQDTQESDLGLGGKLSDFIQEDRASFGQLEASQTPLSRPPESALLMAKQFLRDPIARDFCAVHAHKSPCGAPGKPMDMPGRPLLAPGVLAG